MRLLIYFITGISILSALSTLPVKVRKQYLISKIEEKETFEKIKIDFEIFPDHISLNELKLDGLDTFMIKRIKDLVSVEMHAVIKQTNNTDTTIAVDDLLTWEKFEIINIRKEVKNDLIIRNDPSLRLDYEDYSIKGYRDTKLTPNQTSIDTTWIGHNFRFYKSEPDTLLIRIKKNYFEEATYSNWDTLIIE